MGAQHLAGLPVAEPDARPRLVVHLIEALDALDAAHDGHGLLNLIRHLPPGRYRHAIVCLQDRGGDQGEMRAHGVDIVHLHKRAGRDLGHYLRMFRVLRGLRPDLIHTRNRAGLPAQLVAALAGVKLRVHAEHGAAGAQAQTTAQPANVRGCLLGRLLRPLIDHFIAVSSELEQWLVEAVGAEPARVSQIANGVDSLQYHPRLGPAAAVGPPGFMHDGAFVLGSVGTMDERGNHAMLIDAFLRLIASPHPAHKRLRLLIVGDGPARAACQALLQRAGAESRAWLPGARADIPQLLRAMDLFVLPGVAEGRSNAVLEAMASGLPVVAADVAGHSELVHPGFTGILVPPLSTELLAQAIADYCRIPDMAIRHGARARSQVIARHSMPAMAREYLAVYDALTHPEADATARRPR